MKSEIEKIKLKYFLLSGLVLLAVGVAVFFLVILTDIFIIPQVANSQESGGAVKAMVIFSGVFGVLCGFVMKSLYVINAEVIYFRGSFFTDKSLLDNRDYGNDS